MPKLDVRLGSCPFQILFEEFRSFSSSSVEIQQENDFHRSCLLYFGEDAKKGFAPCFSRYHRSLNAESAQGFKVFFSFHDYGRSLRGLFF